MNSTVLIGVVVLVSILVVLAVWALVEGALAKFRNASDAALRENGEALRAVNAAELGRLLEPLRKSIAESMKATDENRRQTGLLEARFAEHMKTLATSAARFGEQSASFVNAVTGANKAAGNWGESVLEEVLHACNLVKDVNYVAQQGGAGNIPDFQVFDPANRKILVLDAKVSFKRFKEMNDAADAATRAAALAEHVASVRAQIDRLSAKRYHETLTPPAGREDFSYLPFSAMFVPSDAALWEAVREDPAIPEYAYRKGVVLVTPTTLYGLMRLVHESWAAYSTARNQEQIANAAELVVARIDGLFKALEETEAACAKAQEKLSAAKRLAASEGLCIKGPALQIVKLHGKLKHPLKSAALQSPDRSAESD